MNVYPEWWDTTITIYNKFTDPQTRVISWYRNVIPNCFWKYTGDKITVGETVIETDNSICRIPKSDMYLDKYQWENTPNNEMSDYFTIGIGDILVKGEVTDIINEYEAGHRSSDFLAKYKKLQGCMVVEAYSINTGTGRGSEHYYVKGV